MDPRPGLALSALTQLSGLHLGGEEAEGSRRAWTHTGSWGGQLWEPGGPMPTEERPGGAMVESLTPWV